MNRKKKITNMKSVLKRNTSLSVNLTDSSASTNQQQSTPEDNKQLTDRDNRIALDSVIKSRDTDSITTKQRSYQSFTVVCGKELVRKVKAIARKEGLHVNAVVQAMYEEGINSYERLHGPVDSNAKHRSAKDVLFAK